ncbi:MAG: F-box/LRR-repeat protein 3 [Alphaproteobacteria bacterium]|jgi:hypothetical protein|nr:F-box/LRR-repeat protein 3 [Alphaproteobacteria bacterium]
MKLFNYIHLMVMATVCSLSGVFATDDRGDTNIPHASMTHVEEGASATVEPSFIPRYPSTSHSLSSEYADFPLTTLPGTLLRVIGSFLGIEAPKNYRLVCKQINNAYLMPDDRYGPFGCATSLLLITPPLIKQLQKSSELKLAVRVKTAAQDNMCYISGLTNLVALNLKRSNVCRKGYDDCERDSSFLTGPVSNNYVTDDELRHACNLEKLRELKLAYLGGVTDNGLRYVSGIIKLRSLTLTKLPQVTDNGLRHLSITKLDSLTLDYLDNVSDDGLQHVKGIINLGSLSLVRLKQLTSNGLQHISDMIIDTLTLEGLDNLGDGGLRHVGVMKLDFLTLSYLPNVTGYGLQYLKDMELSCLVLSELPSFRSNNFQYLKEIASIRSLTLDELGCYGDFAADNALQHLSGINLDTLTLKRLTIGNTLQHLRGMNLDSFTLKDVTQVTDDSLQHLSGINLRSLTLDDLGNQVTDKGFRHLRGMNLESLTLGDLDSKITGSSLLGLIRTLHNLQDLDIGTGLNTCLQLNKINMEAILRWRPCK